MEAYIVLASVVVVEGAVIAFLYFAARAWQRSADVLASACVKCTEYLAAAARPELVGVIEHAKAEVNAHNTRRARMRTGL